MVTPSFQPGESVDGYEVIRQIGMGGFGTVWLCRPQVTGDYRALKLVSAEDSAVLRRELDALVRYRQVAGQLKSPHLMPVEHVNSNASGLFYVMPLADGFGADDPAEESWRPLTLSALLESRRSEASWFSSAEVNSFICPVLEALQVLLDRGLVHRDVKPDNILFFDGHPCLADISLLGEDAHVITRRGTPGYSAPSWYMDAGGHPDMYGAAATLFTMLTGNPPDKMGKAHFRWPPQGETSLSSEERAEWLRLHRIVLRATEEHPANRFLTYHSFLNAVEGNAVNSATPKRPIVRWALGTVALVTWVLGGAFFLKEHHEPKAIASSQESENAAEVEKAKGQPDSSASKIYSELDSGIEKYAAISSAFSRKRSEFNKQAETIFQNLAKGPQTFENIQKQTTALLALMRDAKSEGESADDSYREFLLKIESLKKSAAAADNSPHGWKTAREFDEKFASVNNELTSVNGWIRQDMSDWSSRMADIIEKFGETLDKKYDDIVAELSKSSDPSASEKISEAQKSLFKQREQLDALTVTLVDSL